MKISQKLKLLAICAVATLLLVGGLGFYVARALISTVDGINQKTIPSMQLLFDLKSGQQLMALTLYKHLLNHDKDKVAEAEAAAEEITAKLRKSLSDYQGMVRSPKGRELYEAEKESLDDYLASIPPFIEKSRANDKDGALALVQTIGAKRIKLAKLIDEHITLNETLALNEARQSNDLARQSERISISSILLGALLIVSISLVVNRGINRSLSLIQTAVSRIEGDLDFTIRAETVGKDEIARVSSALNRLLTKLCDNLATIAESTNKVANSSSHLATASEQVATASAHQNDAAANMAASVEQMTVSINHVGERSAEAHALSQESVRLANTGQDVINQTVSDINAIADSVNHVSSRIKELDVHSSHISTVVSVIREVADQTNLLALNAAIEAARAGEQGRGFAVVADEVRKLAERTATSTKQIAAMIDSIKNVSRDAVEGMGQAVELVTAGVQRAANAKEAIQQIGEGSLQAVVMVEEIASAIREQAQASNNIAGNVEKIAQMAEESSAAAQSSATSAKDLDHLASDMRQIIACYKL